MEVSAEPKSALEQHLEEQIRQDVSQHFWHRLRWRWIRKHLAALDSRSRILDLGAGSGIFGKFIARENRHEYFFVEPIPSLRQKLIAQFGASRDLTEAPNYRGIKSVLMLDVLEHIEDDGDFLKKLQIRLDAGTEVLLLVPARQELYSFWDKELGHFRRYSTGALKQVFRSAGFEVLDARYLFPEFYILGWLRKNFGRVGDSELPMLPSWLNFVVYLKGIFISILLPRPPVGSSAFIRARKL